MKDSVNFQVIPFRGEHAEAFRDLNLAWIRAYFAVEAEDEIQLADPGGYYIRDGGQIFIAEDTSGVLGGVALHREDPPITWIKDDSEDSVFSHVFEVSKMCVRDDTRGRGIGRALMAATLNHAKEIGAEELHIVSNRVLKPALSLYQSVGFVEVPIPEDNVFGRGDIALALRLV
ncbi:MAG: GNAT family N-acetyltransferase [Opitutales bacterium]|nr:GNAT family N-acetyltransferase [Opitutales bacterium]NRA27635.1 GNAT family N-acetyltransferase [Opitutales bacterium]